MRLHRQIAAVAVKELKILSRDRQALALLFAMPIFFIVVMSFALEGVFDAGTRERPVDLRVVNHDQGKLGQQAVDALRKIDGLRLAEAGNDGVHDLEQAEQEIRDGRQRFAVVFANNFSARLVGGDRISTASPVKILIDPAVNRPLQSIVLNMVAGAVEQIRLQNELPGELEALMKAAREKSPLPLLADAAADDTSGALDSVRQAVSDPARRITPEVSVAAGFTQARRPTSTEQNVPAYAIFGVFFIVLTIAKSFLRERSDGTFIRLKTAPLPKFALLAGKLAPYYLVNLLQIALMFSVGVAVFHMRLGNLPAFALVSIAAAGAANGLGLLVAAIGGSEARVDTLSVLLALTLAALGGIMVPAYIMPELLQRIAFVTPHAWALAGYQDVIVRGLGVRDVLPEAGALTGFGVIFALLSLWRLRLE